MAVDLTDLFTRLGSLVAGLNELNTVRETGVPARIATIEATYAAPDLNLVDGLYSALAQWQSSSGSLLNTYRTLAQQTVIQVVNADVAQPNQGLRAALEQLIAEMVTAVASVERNVVSVAVTPDGANTGDGVVVASVTEARGVPCEFCFAETVTGTVTNDSRSGGATAGRESLTFRGTFAATDLLGFDFPRGSGAAGSVVAVSALVDNGRGTANQLFNGTFETFTVANVPDGWHIATGTAGTQVLKSTGEHYTGASSLEFAGDGSTLTAVMTELGVDTTATVKPTTAYVVNFWCKNSANPAAGVLRVALVDGSGTVINDDAGTANSFTVDLTTLGTSWVPKSGFFRTPKLLPASVRLQFKTTTAISNTKNLFLDHAALAEPTVLYPGGPRLAAFSGATAWLLGDAFAVAVANGRAGLLHSGLDRLLGLRAAGLYLPSAASPTLTDGLVV